PDQGFLRYINFDTAIIPWEPGRVKAVLLFDAYKLSSSFNKFWQLSFDKRERKIPTGRLMPMGILRLLLHSV
ncbi:MAG: hypothetical protein FWF59_00890, partial [Turicibacter sp.]|nr:hypothetical protein [Turicibacter sp.]